MEYLKASDIEVEGHRFHIKELTYNAYRAILETEEVDKQSLLAVWHGVPEFQGRAFDEIGNVLPPRIVAKLAREIMSLSVPGDAEGNSEGTPAEDSSSD